MRTYRFSPVVLACAAAASLLSLPAHAQSLSQTNDASLVKGMTPQGVRTFELPKTGGPSTGTKAEQAQTTVGTTQHGFPTTGLGSETQKPVFVVGPTQSNFSNASTNKYTLNSSGQMVNNAVANLVNSGGVMGLPVGASASPQFVVGPTPGTQQSSAVDWNYINSVRATAAAAGFVGDPFAASSPGNFVIGPTSPGQLVVSPTAPGKFVIGPTPPPQQSSAVDWNYVNSVRATAAAAGSVGDPFAASAPGKFVIGPTLNSEGRGSFNGTNQFSAEDYVNFQKQYGGQANWEQRKKQYLDYYGVPNDAAFLAAVTQHVASQTSAPQQFVVGPTASPQFVVGAPGPTTPAQFVPLKQGMPASYYRPATNDRGQTSAFSQAEFDQREELTRRSVETWYPGRPALSGSFETVVERPDGSLWTNGGALLSAPSEVSGWIK